MTIGGHPLTTSAHPLDRNLRIQLFPRPGTALAERKAMQKLLRRALDALDVGVVVLSADAITVLYQNATATALLASPLPETISDAIRTCIAFRRSASETQPALRVELAGRPFFVRAIASEGDPPLEIALIREEVVRDADAFRLLESRYSISRREYHVLAALRLGKANGQIAAEL